MLGKKLRMQRLFGIVFLTLIFHFVKIENKIFKNVLWGLEIIFYENNCICFIIMTKILKKLWLDMHNCIFYSVVCVILLLRELFDEIYSNSIEILHVHLRLNQVILENTKF